MDCKTPKSYKRIQVTAVFIAQEEYHQTLTKKFDERKVI